MIYRREGANAYVATFEIAAAGRIDAVSQTDGIAATSANLGPAFPQGLFIAQDGKNDDCNQNFKLVPWHSIAAAIGQAPSAQHHSPTGAQHLIARAVRQGTSAAATQKDTFLPFTMVGC